MQSMIRCMMSMGVVLLCLACSGGSEEASCEDDTAAWPTGMIATGTFGDWSFSSELDLSQCKDPNVGRASLSCEPSGLVITGEVPATEEGYDETYEDSIGVKIAISEDYFLPDTYDLIGKSTGIIVWKETLGFSPDAEETLSSSITLTSVTPNQSATGIFEATWEGDIPVQISGSFDVNCEQEATE